MNSISHNASKLELVDSIKPFYILPKDNLAKEVLIPCMHCALHVNCMMGFFTSQSLSSIAPGLATFINTTNNSMRLIISPYLNSEDREAIESGATNSDHIYNKYISDLTITSDLIEQHTLKCLAHLIANKRIEIKIAVMKGALFHPKVWIIEDENTTVAVHGSMNMTDKALNNNKEQVSVSLSWGGNSELYTINKLKQEFDILWNEKDDECIVVDLSEASKEQILLDYHKDIVPQEEDFLNLYHRVLRIKKPNVEKILYDTEKKEFKIPNSLIYDSGPFKHQGEAVSAWCKSNYNGILEMATGSGKTITSMIAAYNLYKNNHPLLIVVAAPYIPLIEQWCEEIEPFGLSPINIGRIDGRKAKIIKLDSINRKFRHNNSKVEIIVITHDTLCDTEYQSELAKIDCNKLLIADEVHNLGRMRFISNPPDFFNYRIGLSATPERQFDEEGTSALYEYFGDVVYSFKLDQAIGTCLVEYDYFIHPVYLKPEEMDNWYEVTAEIKQNSWRIDNDKHDDYLSALYRKRRLILETASDKISTLSNILDSEDVNNLKHTLIYCSDKQPEQLILVNELLIDKGLLFHQLTQEETSNRDLCKNIIQNFQDNKIQILTSKRVLDEGVNIPQIEKAFILASTTVERQWIQRRGRLLRKCSSINKTHAEIHDFITLPPKLDNSLDEGAKKLIQSELKRVQHFARLARNAGREDGPINIITKLIEVIF